MKKTTKKPKRLVLNAEKIRELTLTRVKEVVGGAGDQFPCTCSYSVPGGDNAL